jgi:hypothetical protein
LYTPATTKALEEQQGLPDCDRLSFDERLAMQLTCPGPWLDRAEEASALAYAT